MSQICTRESRRQNICSDAAGIDKINSLPDDILIEILSRLPVKDAVRTSILSPRWRNLWIPAVENVDIDGRLVFNPVGSSSSSSGMQNLRKVSFLNFAGKILPNIPRIKSCRVSCTVRYDASHVNAWIRAEAASTIRDLQELDLDLCFLKKGSRFQLPDTLYQSHRLVVLKLRSQIDLNVPDSVNFPRLKVLHLESLPWLDDANLGKILTGSPILEELSIHRYHKFPYDCIKTADIRSSSLKTLVITSYSEFRKSTTSYGITTGHGPVELEDNKKSSNLSALDEAKIDVWKDVQLVFKLMLQLVSNVKALCLSGFAVSVFHTLFTQTSRSFPPFPNLNRLEVLLGEHTEAWDLATLQVLRCTPILQVLVISKVHEKPSLSHPQLVGPPVESSQIPCLSSSLEVVEYKGFKGRPTELDFAEYFLEQAVVLKKMILSYPADDDGRSPRPEKKLGLLKMLSGFKRGSTECQIAFS